MFVLFNGSAIDSKDVKKMIEENTSFKILNDLSSASKREDIIAFNMSVSMKVLKEILQEDGYDLEYENIEEIVDECMSVADDLALDMDEILPLESVFLTYAYKYDEVKDEILLVFAMADNELGEMKLNDILKRLLRLI